MPLNIVEQDPRDRNFVADPYSQYANWHRNGKPIFWKNYGFWCLFEFDDVNRVLRDRRFARRPPDIGPPRPDAAHMHDFAAAEQFSLLALEPPQHTRLRKFVNRAFISHQVTRMAPFITAIAHACIDRFEADSQVELLQQFATPIPLNVITHLLGVPESVGPDLVAWSHAMVRVYTLTQTHDEELAANRAAAEFRAYLFDLLNLKRRQPADDLLSHLLTQGDVANPISDEEIVSVTILLLNAGHEATVHQLGNAVNILLAHFQGDQRVELSNALAHNDSAESIVAECLRYAAPLHLFTRYAQEAVTLAGGVELAAGDEIGLLLAAANRCPQQFQHPDLFIANRSDATHLSLGAGIHYCVGAHLAKLELRIALQVLFERLPTLTLAKTPQYQDAYHFHGLESLHVRW